MTHTYKVGAAISLAELRGHVVAVEHERAVLVLIPVPANQKEVWEYKENGERND